MKKPANIYILGAHKLSTNYFHKLKNAGFQNLHLVSNNEKDIQQSKINPNFIIQKSYADFILDHLNTNKLSQNDLLVPDHTAKHVLLQVFFKFAEKKNKTPQLSAINSNLKTPFLYKSDDNTIWATSFATWTCPADCPEPQICPHTENTRDWDMNVTLGNALSILQKQGHSCHRFACDALFEEICSVSFEKIYEERQRFNEHLKNGSKDFVIATHSRCHGILGKFSIV